jgi:proteasome lid subunit RPN8/RPN11
MEAATLDAVRSHAAREYPRECCGLVIVEKGRERYVPCTNAAITASEHFVLPATEFAAAEDRGEIVRLIHSHPDVSAWPTDADRRSCEVSGLPWTIISWPTGELHTIVPCGYEAPLVGRSFAHGVLDCYTLVRDWYRLERGIELPDFNRPDNWWDDGESDLYTQGFPLAGFRTLSGADELGVGDVILMQRRSGNGVPNHAGVYVGDGHFLHHMYGRLSSRDVYGGYWSDITVAKLRFQPA